MRDFSELENQGTEKIAKTAKIGEKTNKTMNKTATPKRNKEITQTTEQIETTTIDIAITEGEVITTVKVVENRLIQGTNAQQEMQFAIFAGFQVTG